MCKVDFVFIEDFYNMYLIIWGDGVILKKYKELIGVFIFVVECCEFCLCFYLWNVKGVGVILKELVEVLCIGLFMGGLIILLMV